MLSNPLGISGTIRIRAIKEAPKSRSGKFTEAAGYLECHEDEARWDERLKTAAKPVRP
jgi:hypothetical protein